MKVLTKEQIEDVIEWLNDWNQLRDTAIPMRFKEEYMQRLQHCGDIKLITLNELREECRRRGYIMNQAADGHDD